MKGGLGDPAVSLMLSSRWSYTGTHHLSSSFTSLQSDFYAARLSKGFMSEDAKGLERRRFPTPSSLLFLTAGALTCKVTNTTAGPAGSLGTHHASTTGEQSGLLSSTLKWRHPSDCCGLALGMLPDHSLGNWHWEGGSERERSGWREEEEEKGGQGNTVIRSEETVAQINSEACPPHPPLQTNMLLLEHLEQAPPQRH